MINFNNVGFSYGNKKILNNLSFGINKNERVCISGESGCGKTTVLRLIASLNKAKGVFVSGKVSFVFQDDRLILHLTAKQNISIFSDEKTAENLLNKLNLENEKNTAAQKLSGGMAKRVNIARALAVPFDILLLDEPFSGLDEQNKQTAADLINSYTENKTAVLVTHNPDDAKLLNCKFLNIF